MKNMDLTYENYLEETITPQQAEILGEYHKVYSNSAGAKRKELYRDGVLVSVIFYPDVETDEEILATYSSVQEVIIRTTSLIDNYTKIITRDYWEGIYKGISITVLNAANQQIYLGDWDAEREEIILGKVIKFLYFEEEDDLQEYYYNEDGSLHKMYNGEKEAYHPNEIAAFFGAEWADLSYYHHASPIVPER